MEDDKILREIMIDVMNQAIEVSPTSYMRDDNCVIHMGMKISYDPARGVRVYDTTKGGANYIEIEPVDYMSLMTHGWVTGVRIIKVKTYMERIDMLTEMIKEAIADGARLVTVTNLKNRRAELTTAYADAKHKLNTISHEESN